MYESSPAEKAALQVSLEELAVNTAHSCFAEADANGDGYLTFEEYRNWCLSDPVAPSAGEIASLVMC